MTQAFEPIHSNPYEGVPRRAVALGVAVILVPFVVAVVAALVDPSDVLIRDHALMEMRVRDIGSHPVQLGLYSRDGWSHPGPLVFFTLLLPYRIFGSGAAGLEIGALLVNAAAAVGLVVVARRVGGARCALVFLLGAAVLLRALGSQLLIDAWVCSITTVPFALFLATMWAVVAGRFWALPLGAFLASWLVQTHVGYAPLAPPLLVLAAAVLVVRIVRAHDRDEVRRLLIGAGGAVLVLAVVWALPLWDQVRGRGNLAAIVDWFSTTDEPPHTIAEGMRIVFGQFAAAPDWVTGTRRVSPVSGEALLGTDLRWPILVIPFVVALLLAWRRGYRTALLLAGVVITTLVLAVVAVARTVGTMYEYRLLWTWALGMVAAAMAAWVFWSALADRRPTVDRGVSIAVLVVVAGLGIAQIADVGAADRSWWSSAELEHVARQIESRYRPDGGQIVLRASTQDGGWYLQGLLVELEKRGYAARVPAGDDGGVFGDHRQQGPGPVQADLEVVAARAITGLRPGSADIVAYAGPRPLPAQQRFLRELDARGDRLFARYRAGVIDDTELGRRFDRLQAGPAAVAVVAGRS